MKLTPLDIHHKEFRHSIRGYSEEEVDQFLDEVADEFERLFKENIDKSEKLEAAEQKLREYQQQEETIRNTMVAAQRSAEEIVSKAREEAETILRDAEVKAKEIIHNALQQKQKVQNELIRIKQAEEEFRARFRQLLEGHVSQLSEVKLPDDVTVMMGQTDEGVVGAVEVATQQAADAVAEVADAAEVRAAEGVPEQPTPEPPTSPEAAPAEAAPVEQQELPSEPPDAGFVTGVILGETEPPEVAVEEPDLDIEAPEFDPASLSSFGDREDDIDIEEID